jgi:hypothetical protein
MPITTGLFTALRLPPCAFGDPPVAADLAETDFE